MRFIILILMGTRKKLPKSDVTKPVNELVDVLQKEFIFRSISEIANMERQTRAALDWRFPQVP